MSKSTPQVVYGQIGHTSEPFDGTETDMHRCADCTRSHARRWDHMLRDWTGCARFVPSVTQPVRCDEFTPRRSK